MVRNGLLVIVAALIGLPVASPAARAADGPPAAARRAELPEPGRVAALDDAGLCEVYARLYPKPEETLSGYQRDEPLAALKEAVLDEVRGRGANRLAAYLAVAKSPDLTGADETTVLMLLYAVAPERYGEPPAPRERVEPIARRAVEMGGRPRAVALTQYRLGDVGWMSDGLLRELLPTLRGHTSGRGNEAGRNRERLLGEMVRRGGPAWEKVLVAELAEIRARAAAKEPIERFRLTPTLETLTALRRVQGKGDPLRVEVKGPAEVECTFPALPTLDVALVSADAMKEAVWIMHGGDYRSGRQARWRIEARDAAAGTVLPARGQLFGMGGGLSGFGPLAAGGRWKTSLRGGSFLHALPPGRYTLRVLYHDSVCIADEAGVDGLIVSASEPFTLTVKPLEIPRADVDAAKVRGLLAGIDERATLKVVAGTYGNWAHKLVGPDSPQGRLLAMGLPAVPTLVEALEDAKLTPARRAVVLSLLFGLTGQNDPRFEAGVVGGFESADGPWMIAGGDGAAGFGSGSMNLGEGAKIDEAKQRAFAKRWEAWKGYLKIAAPEAAGRGDSVR